MNQIVILDQDTAPSGAETVGDMGLPRTTAQLIIHYINLMHIAHYTKVLKIT